MTTNISNVPANPNIPTRPSVARTFAPLFTFSSKNSLLSQWQQKEREKNNQISSKREERRARRERETDLNSFNSGDISSGHVGPLTVSATHGDKATLSDVCTDVPFARSLDQISRMIAARFCFVLLRLR